jgi:peptidoglycan/LPS O-acetylase OafA/YrhL
MRANNRNSLPDYLRHGLALMVIASHVSFVLDGGNQNEPLMRATGGLVSFGTLAVLGFFVLSGHLIAQSWRRDPNIARYTRRRVLRIMPGLCVTLIFGSVLTWWFDNFSKNPLAGAYNATLWTLWLEGICYILLLLSRGRPWLIFALVVFLIALGHHDVAPVAIFCFGVGILIPRLPNISLPPLPFDYSYGLYIYGFHVQQALRAMGVHTPVALFVLTLACAIPISALSWHFVEKPPLRFKPSAQPQRQLVAAENGLHDHLNSDLRNN